MTAKPFCDGPFKAIKGTSWIVGKDKQGDNCYILDQRGWGYLTGKGHAALGLDIGTAAKMQDDTQQWVVDALNAAWEARDTKAQLAKAVEALRTLSAIADAFDENELDDEARKFWGKHYEHENHTPHDQIEIYSGRGGKRLLTLSDAMNARAVLAEIEKCGDA